jgi:hypothetical protein
VAKRGEEIPRPKPWTVRAADRRAGEGWEQLVAQSSEAADRAWVAMTSDPRRTTDRQHPLKGELSQANVGGTKLDQWELEVTGSGRDFYAIDDQHRTLWITEAGPGHPKATDTRRRKQR